MDLLQVQSNPTFHASVKGYHKRRSTKGACVANIHHAFTLQSSCLHTTDCTLQYFRCNNNNDLYFRCLLACRRACLNSAGTTETVVLSLHLLKINKRGRVQKRGSTASTTTTSAVFCSCWNSKTTCIPCYVNSPGRYKSCGVQFPKERQG